jgi:hypothetical protein
MLGRRCHLLEEVLRIALIVKANCKLVLLIGGGGAIRENVCHFDNTHHPFARSKPALKIHFFLRGINGMI